MLTDLQKMGNGAVKITFGEGAEAKTYTARALTLSDIVEFQADICLLADFENRPELNFAGLRYMLWCSLRHDMPELTLKEAGDLFEMPDLEELEELVKSFFLKRVRVAKPQE